MAKDVWDALKKLYEGRTTLILVDLGRRLQTTRCAEEDSVRKHSDRLTDLHEQLAAMGESMLNAEYALILMGSLPLLYQPTLNAISAAAEISGTISIPATVIKPAIDGYDRRTLKGGKAQDEAVAADAQLERKGKGRLLGERRQQGRSGAEEKEWQHER